jgi:hypothetical protein
MKIQAINNFYLNKNTINNRIKRGAEPAPIQTQTDSVSFKGTKNAIKGAAILGVAGAIVGAIVSGGASIVPTMIYFGTCNGIIGAAAGSGVDDND